MNTADHAAHGAQRAAPPATAGEHEPTAGNPHGIHLLEAIFAAATDHAIITTDVERKVLVWNSGAERLFGYRAVDMVGSTADRLFTPEDQGAGVPQQEIDNAIGTGRAADYRWHVRRDGSRFWADGTMTPIHEPDGSVCGFLKILRDATDKQRAEAELVTLARHDTLTGLPNRAACMAKLADECAAARRSGQLVLLLLLDLDHFKEVNDTFGHDVGDHFLQQAVQRISATMRDTDFFARLGGDEFIILQPGTSEPSDGAVLADKLVAALAAPFLVDGHDIHAGISAGITVYPSDGSDADRLLKNADLAMYEVKKHGGHGFRYFTTELDRAAHQRSSDLAALRHAVAAHHFYLEYQPQVDAGSGALRAVEALLRCRDTTLAAYPIDRVIVLAQQSGLIVNIGLWMMDEACMQLRQWRDSGLPPFRMCINLCTEELLAPDLLDCVDAALAHYLLRGSDLEVEVTERQLLEHGTRGTETLHALRARGISTALDDFGTGYSSLAYLRDLPVDRVKLDQSFLKKIPADFDSCAIASAVVNLVHTLKRESIIEGVESDEQAAFFRTLGSDLLQGFHFSHPLAPGRLAGWLAGRAPA